MPRRAWLIVSSSNCQSLLREKRKRASDFVILLLPLFALSVFPYIVLLLALPFSSFLLFILILYHSLIFLLFLYSPFSFASFFYFTILFLPSVGLDDFFLFYSSLFSYFILVLLDDLFSIFSFSLFVSIESMLSVIASFKKKNFRAFRAIVRHCHDEVQRECAVECYEYESPIKFNKYSKKIRELTSINRMVLIIKEGIRYSKSFIKRSLIPDFRRFSSFER